MAVKLCSCGTCETASMRAVALIGKMMDDDECALFSLAVGQSMVAILGAVVHLQTTQMLENGGTPSSIASSTSLTLTEMVVGDVHHDVLKHLKSNDMMGHIIDSLNVNISKAMARKKAEANLPKGD